MTVGYWPNRYWPEYWPTYWPLGGVVTPIVTPDCRIYMIGAEGRTAIIAVESRQNIIDPENRTVQVSCTSGGI